MVSLMCGVDPPHLLRIELLALAEVIMVAIPAASKHFKDGRLRDAYFAARVALHGADTY